VGQNGGKVRDHIGEYLADVRDELFRLADSHDVCFEDDSDDCQFDTVREAAELIDQVVVYRSPHVVDGATYRKGLLEDELA
jgi:hypothetical protein